MRATASAAAGRRAVECLRESSRTAPTPGDDGCEGPLRRGGSGRQPREPVSVLRTSAPSSAADITGAETASRARTARAPDPETRYSMSSRHLRCGARPASAFRAVAPRSPCPVPRRSVARAQDDKPAPKPPPPEMPRQLGRQAGLTPRSPPTPPAQDKPAQDSRRRMRRRGSRSRPSPAAWRRLAPASRSRASRSPQRTHEGGGAQRDGVRPRPLGRRLAMTPLVVDATPVTRAAFDRQLCLILGRTRSTSSSPDRCAR
jgi:hypothetical protein